MKVRTKHYVMLTYGSNVKAYIHVYPQQKWLVNACGNGVVVIERKGMNIEIPIADYEKYFIEIN